MFKLTIAMILCILAGCASTPPEADSVCSTQPGTYACQIERYYNADG